MYVFCHPPVAKHSPGFLIGVFLDGTLSFVFGSLLELLPQTA
jgi:hypothetical protein